MNANRSGRRQFLKQAAAGLATGAAGLAAGSEWSARGQSAGLQTKDTRFGHGEPSRFVTSGRGVRRNINHITYFTPIQDYAGIITPTGLHFVQLHENEMPDIDPREHRLTIHGLVDRPLSFSLDDLQRLPSVSRIHFVECQGNGSAANHGSGNPNMGCRSSTYGG
jgi:sulfane dehydrogenase subunit SoxC